VSNKQAEELRDIAEFFAKRGDMENARWLTRAAETIEASFAFFAWFNRNHPDPSAHPEHPWSVLGQHFVPPHEHTTTPECWCDPYVDYVDPDTGIEVWVHREVQ
jgi:hypothetical protein